MEQFWEFRYTVPRPAGDGLVKLTAAEAERLLLDRVLDESIDRNEALWELGRFYCQCRQHDKAMECLRQIIERLPDPERKAACVLAMGQTMEQTHDYDAAIGYYREALALEPIQTPTWYFIQNNLGYCLVTRGKPEEAEIYCRKAIEIDQSRPNAHKNLGLALQGQGRVREAARCFVSATRVDAADARSFGLLTRLLEEQPELRPEFAVDAECCRQAVEIAAAEARHLSLGTGSTSTS